MKQLLLHFSPDPVPSLENFVPGRNAELLHSVRELANGLCGERFVYLWGDGGSGKSHLLRGAAAAAWSAGMEVCFGSGEVPEESESCGLAVVDDVHLLDGGAQIALFNLYNRLRDEGGRLLASGPCAPAQLPLRPDVVTRLGWGLIYQLHGLADEEKSQALQAHAAARGFRLPPEVPDYLLRHWRRDLPSLLAALEALDRYSLENKRAVTVPLLRQLMQEGEL
ncbi:MAG: DnaA regulatory inactivator Hda [Sulfuricellaceae bacterium]|nr:DnaA regulatory inactivator Hda [Sulfuricellaceae bacterium]